MMNLALIKGRWTGDTAPTIYSIEITNASEYGWEGGRTHLVYDVSVHYDWEGTGTTYIESLTSTHPIFHDDGTWTFMMTSERINKGPNGFYRENLDGSSVSVNVKYTTADNPVPQTATDMFLSDIGPASEHRYKLQTSAPSYLVVNSGGLDTVLDVSSRVTTFTDGAAPVGSKLKVYAVWENRDLTNGTVINNGVVEKDLVVTGENNLSVRVPGEANRVSVRTLAYNERDLDFLAPVMPTSQDDVLSKTELWKYKEQKFIRTIDTATYNAAWEYAKSRSIGRIDPYRLAGVTLLGGDANAIAMVDPKGICYSYADPTPNFTNFYNQVLWDGAQYTKVFRGNDIVLGLKADGTVIPMGYVHTNISTYLAANPFPLGVKKIAISNSHAVALMENGTVVNRHDTIAAYKTWSEVVNSWTGIVDIEIGNGWIVGVKADGTVVSTSNSATFAQDRLSGLTGKFVKKVFKVAELYPIFIHDAGRVFLPGSDAGLYEKLANIRTAVATWPDQINHLVMVSKYYVYGFCDDDSKKQVWCTDSFKASQVNDWSHIVAATEYKNGILAIRCDGQILSSDLSDLEIPKTPGTPITWSASELVPI